MATDPHRKSTTRLPPWLKKRGCLSDDIHAVKQSLRDRNLHTVCEEARCPNLGECFSRGTATIMIMGDICTRRCGFCSVAGGTPAPLDHEEPNRVAAQIKEMSLKHAVVTSVTRDDLPDGGASHFARTIAAIRAANPSTTIEALTPDFKGTERDIKTVCDARPHVYNHNIETVRRLTPKVRNMADYDRSLGVLTAAKLLLPDAIVKSGLMVGLGERTEEVEEALADLKKSGCSVVTIGQYLRPSKDSLPVAEYVTPERFKIYEEIGLKRGLKFVFSGPFVRSSYLADKVLY